MIKHKVISDTKVANTEECSVDTATSRVQSSLKRREEKHAHCKLVGVKEIFKHFFRWTERVKDKSLPAFTMQLDEQDVQFIMQKKSRRQLERGGATVLG